jgi:Ca2+-transporting ATPase
MTDIFPELALAGEPPEGEVLALPPRRSGAAMFSPRDLARVGVDGALIAGAALAALAYGTARYGAGARAGTLSFVTLTSAQLLYAESARSEHHTMFDSTRLASNRYLPITIATSLGAQLLATFLPATRSLLGITRLGAGDWGVAASCALAPLVASETIKLLTRDANPAAPAPEPESTQEPASAT